MREPQDADADREPDGVEHEEQHVLAVEARAAAVAEGPVAVAEVRDGRGDADADDLGGQDLARERAAAVAEQVEQADVDDERDEPDDTELRHLVHEVLDAPVEGAEQRAVAARGRCRHRAILPVGGGGSSPRAAIRG